jgi:hypothetical protein
MKSKTTRQFWKLFDRLPKTVQLQAVIAYRRWRQDPYHPGMHFKQVGKKVPVYSVRIGKSWRVLGLLKGDTITWFWIGSHEEYNKLLPHL